MRKQWEHRISAGVVAPLMVLALEFGSINPAFADTNTPPAIQVWIDGQQLTFDQPPVIVNSRTLVPISGIVKPFGFDVKWDGATETITASKGDTVVTLQIGSDTAYINHQPVTMDAEPEILNGRTMVPLSFISSAFQLNISWDGPSRTIKITTNGQSNASTATQSTNSLTYDQAVQLAYANSVAVRNATSSIDQAADIKKNLADKVDYIPLDTSNPTATNIWKGFLSADSQYQSAKQALTIQQDQVAYSVKQAYDNVLQSQLAKQIADLSLQQLQLKRQNAQVSFENGMISQVQMDQTQQAVAAAQASEKVAQSALDSAYMTLDQLLGLQASARPTLVDQPTTRWDDSTDLDTHVSQIINSSPLTYLYQQQANLAQLNVNYYVWNDPSNPNQTPYDATKIASEQQQNNVTGIKQTQEQVIRSAYSTLVKMQNQYNALQLQLHIDQQTLAVTKTKYDAGLVTKADLEDAELAVAIDNQNLFAITAAMDQAKMIYDKPWAYNPSSSASSSSPSSSLSNSSSSQSAM